MDSLDAVHLGDCKVTVDHPFNDITAKYFWHIDIIHRPWQRVFVPWRETDMWCTQVIVMNWSILYILSDELEEKSFPHTVIYSKHIKPFTCNPWSTTNMIYPMSPWSVFKTWRVTPTNLRAKHADRRTKTSECPNVRDEWWCGQRGINPLFITHRD